MSFITYVIVAFIFYAKLYQICLSLFDIHALLGILQVLSNLLLRIFSHTCTYFLFVSILLRFMEINKLIFFYH